MTVPTPAARRHDDATRDRALQPGRAPRQGAGAAHDAARRPARRDPASDARRFAASLRRAARRAEGADRPRVAHPATRTSADEGTRRRARRARRGNPAGGRQGGGGAGERRQARRRPTSTASARRWPSSRRRSPTATPTTFVAGAHLDAKTARDQLESYLQKYREAVAREAENAAPADARIIASASEPREPTFPKKVPTDPARDPRRIVRLARRRRRPCPADRRRGRRRRVARAEDQARRRARRPRRVDRAAARPEPAPPVEPPPEPTRSPTAAPPRPPTLATPPCHPRADDDGASPSRRSPIAWRGRAEAGGALTALIAGEEERTRGGLGAGAWAAARQARPRRAGRSRGCSADRYEAGLRSRGRRRRRSASPNFSTDARPSPRPCIATALDLDIVPAGVGAVAVEPLGEALAALAASYDFLVMHAYDWRSPAALAAARRRRRAGDRRGAGAARGGARRGARSGRRGCDRRRRPEERRNVGGGARRLSVQSPARPSETAQPREQRLEARRALDRALDRVARRGTPRLRTGRAREGEGGVEQRFDDLARLVLVARLADAEVEGRRSRARSRRRRPRAPSFRRDCCARFRGRRRGR